MMPSISAIAVQDTEETDSARRKTTPANKIYPCPLGLWNKITQMEAYGSQKA